MTNQAPSPCIVVGYDGSPSSRAALRLAVDRVGGGKIFLVHGYAAPADYWGTEHHDQLLNVALTRGEDLSGGPPPTWSPASPTSITSSS